MDAPVLPYSDPSLPYLLDTDDGTQGVGAVLSQDQEGQERVVPYHSRKLSNPERNYCVAVVVSCSYF